MEGCDPRNAAAGRIDSSSVSENDRSHRSGSDRNTPKRRKTTSSPTEEESERRIATQVHDFRKAALNEINPPGTGASDNSSRSSSTLATSPKAQQQFNLSTCAGNTAHIPTQQLFGIPQMQGSPPLGLPPLNTGMGGGAVLNYPGWSLRMGLPGSSVGNVVPNADARLSLFQQQLLMTSMTNPVLSQAIGLHLRNNAGAAAAAAAFVGNSSAAALVAAASQAGSAAGSSTSTPSTEDIETANEPDLSGRPSVSLYMACDDDALSEYQCLVRKQIELFEARREDVDSNAQGRNRPIVMGQVGIRCRHCTMLPPKHRARGAVYYPAKLYGLYQAAQNMASGHLCEHCQHVNEELRSELLKLRERKSAAGGGKKYWADAVRILGVFEDESGLRFERR